MQALLQILMDPIILGWSCPDADPDPGFANTKKDNFHITSFFSNFILSVSGAFKLQVLNQRVCTYDNVCIANEEAEETINDSMHEDPDHDKTLCFHLKFL
jgi:hypothetical protein